jgi:hypothetical protein
MEGSYRAERKQRKENPCLAGAMEVIQGDFRGRKRGEGKISGVKTHILTYVR